MFKRDVLTILKTHAQFPVVGIFGPRQSGKTTLACEFFKKHHYLNFEHPTVRAAAENDPEGFLKEHENKHGIILDEFQHVPQILSYIQVISDFNKRPGYFVITGSQNFLMNQAITQSLAGRIAILTLLPLSMHELQKNKLMPSSAENLMFHGCYPRIYEEKVAARVFYESYIHSYVERDVRQLVNVEKLRTFQKFMMLCAGRIGQQLNVSDLSAHCGVHRETIDSWISILEASYVIFFLQPYWESFNKRVTKTPKLYFYDTGLACALLGLKSPQELVQSIFYGHFFENLVIADLYKQYLNKGDRPLLYFWRDKNGYLEIDCLIYKAGKLTAIEIKSGMTVKTSFFDSLSAWNELAQSSPENNYLVYGGDRSSTRSVGNLISWKNAGTLITKTG